MAASRLIHLSFKTLSGLGCLGAVPEGPRRLRLSSECGKSLNPLTSSLFGYYPVGFYPEGYYREGYYPEGYYREGYYPVGFYPGYYA